MASEDQSYRHIAWVLYFAKDIYVLDESDENYSAALNSGTYLWLQTKLLYLCCGMLYVWKLCDDDPLRLKDIPSNYSG